MLDFDDDSGDDGSVMDAYFAQMQASSLMPPNVSFLAFTATPKAETKTLFGTPTGEEDEDGNPVMGSFHLYPMRQAIEEGYIIDPLSGYVPLKTLTRIEDESEDADGRLVDERRAEEEDRQVALAPPDERHGEGQVDHRPLRRQRGAAPERRGQGHDRHLRAVPRSCATSTR